MVFGPWIETFVWLRSLFPRWHPKAGFRIRRPKFNFITLHYIYLISMTILGSIILYPAKNMAYIDALFFASGAATQSGLNTVNLNDINTYQQVTLMLIASVCNPIFINTFVVFVRLYWFEKRFQNVVIEAQRIRRTRTMARGSSRSRTKSEARADHDTDLEERGVGHRRIVVMHPSAGTIEQAHKVLENQDVQHNGSDSNSSATANDREKSSEEFHPPAITRREITFADEVPRPNKHDGDDDRMPIQRDADQHIAFLERQRNPDGDDVLFIPGPRDFDRGHTPQQLRSEKRRNPLQPVRSNETFPGIAPNVGQEKEEQLNEDGQPSKADDENQHSGGYLWSRAKDAILRPRKSQASLDPNDPDAQHLRHRGRTKTFASFMSSRTEEKDPMPYLSYAPTVYRNSAFVGLSEKQREELGGIEYRALKTLAATLCIFYVGFQLFGMLSFLPWISNASPYYQGVLEGDGVNRYWWSIFTAASMFNDLGFTLTPDSMISFNRAIWPLISGTFLIVIGNTGFPCMLRFCIWLLSKVTRYGSPLWEEFKFLLDHPRRCFTLLFPSKATWWLFWILVVLNVTDLILFIILDLHDETVIVLSPGIRVLNGWFQAVSTRTAGFAVVNLAQLHPAIQVSYLIMMYISVFPIAISVRRTNVYEENSLGVYAAQDDEADGEQSYVGTHLRRQLSFDLWYVFLGLFIIAIVEGNRLENTNEFAFTLFSVLFEIVSAYGTVGLSLGYPGIDASFSAEFRTISKLVIIAMQIRGRHRGLPYALDKAVLLPSETLHQKEIAEANRRAQRRDSIRSSLIGDEEIGPLNETNRVRSDLSVRSRSRQRERDDTLRPQSRGSTWPSEAGLHKGANGIGRLLTSALSAGPTLKNKRND